MSDFERAFALYQSGDRQKAEDICRAATTRNPSDANCLHLLSVIKLELGKLDAALNAIDRAIALTNSDAGAHNTRGNILVALRRPNEAIESFTTALRLAPANGAVRLNRAAAFNETGNPDLALNEIKRAVSEGANPIDAAFVTALALRAKGEFAEALNVLQSLAAAQPDDARIWQNIGETHFRIGQLAPAETAFARAVELAPNLADAVVGLAAVLGRMGRMAEATQLYDGLIAREPANAHALANRGITRLAAGFPDNAFKDLTQACALDPANVRAARALLATSLYLPALSSKERLKLHTAFGNRFTPEQACCPPIHEANTKRRLKLGFVSSDFRKHPVARNLMPLIEHLDRRQFHLHAYVDTPSADETGAKLLGLFDAHRNITSLSDEAAARQIAEDGIDILLLLAGHFDENRPLIAAHGAAPIQISFHDPATSGIPLMNYLIADPILAPRSTASNFTERLLRLPHFYLHTSIANAVPSLRRVADHPVFGCLNNPAKISDETLALWRRLLGEIQTARLLLKYHSQYDDTLTRRRILEALGPYANRVIFRAGQDTQGDHLAIYQEIDLALDPAPFSGSTTSFEALSMGVTVLTLPGESMVSRWTASILHGLKLENFIARDMTHFIEIAKYWTSHTDALRTLRHELPNRVAASALCDPVRYAANFGRLMRAVWCRAINQGKA